MSIGEETEVGKKDEEDSLKFRPNPDMLVSKSVPADKVSGATSGHCFILLYVLYWFMWLLVIALILISFMRLDFINASS